MERTDELTREGGAAPNRGPVRAPLLSVVLIAYNMRRELPRTLYALTPAYQRRIAAEEYEVIVVDNGSPDPFPAAEVERFGPNFRHIRIAPAAPSPAAAVNLGVCRARGDHVGILIDGARIPSPGLLHFARLALTGFPRPVVTTVSYDLGPDMQIRSLKAGYDAAVEDRLLDAVDWRADGYRLFRIASFNSSADFGALARIAETNTLFLPRALFDAMGGYDPAFDLPGGGLVNHDAFIRAAGLPGSTLVRLIGEGTFHQIHAQSCSARPVEEVLGMFRLWREQYAAIRGRPFEKLRRTPICFGEIHPEVLPVLARSCALALERRQAWQALAAQPGGADDALAAFYRDYWPDDG